ncbi:MAG: DNA helicase PcrA [Bacillota bacterium]
MDLLKNLNDRQREAVLNTEGPLLVLAGAGSGKTRVLTTRVAHLILNRGVSPMEILAITFTNKAAGEMKERVASMVPERVRDLWVCTFHAACMRILRRQAAFAGYSRNFSVYDEGDQQTVIKGCLKDLNVDEKKFPPRSVISAVSSAKNLLITPEEFDDKAYDYYTRVISRVYRLYQERLVASNALDFDDILMATVRLFRENPHVLKYYQNKFRYIMVDEYQDTNHAQYVLVNMLAEAGRNLCVVGDPDQGIYSWRGANIKNILDFEKDYPEARVITLEQNYRSTQTILDAANYVIMNNPGRKEKKLWTAEGTGSPVILYTGDTERSEADFIAGRIERLHCDEGISYGDFAVFYRTNAMSRAIEEAMVRRGLPYRIVGGLRFYDRKEIKDLLAYLRLVDNPADTASLNRIINVPKRGIGEASLKKLTAFAGENGLNCVEALLQSSRVAGLTGKVRLACEKLGRILSESRECVEDTGVTGLVERILEKTGYWEELQSDKTVESITRQENIKEFMTVTGDFDRNSGEGTLTEFLGGVALVADMDSYDRESGQIALMTLHSAKGLEFPVVFLVGMEEGVFPHSRALDDKDEMYEERRLAYVGITRARKMIYLTRCLQRTLYGATRFNQPSRFLEEIPPQLTSVEDPFFKREARAWSVAGKAVAGASIGQGVPNRAPGDFSEGDSVRHAKWGLGTVINVRGRGDSAEIKVEFQEQGVKTLLAKYAPLEKISGANSP